MFLTFPSGLWNTNTVQCGGGLCNAVDGCFWVAPARGGGPAGSPFETSVNLKKFYYMSTEISLGHWMAHFSFFSFFNSGWVDASTIALPSFCSARNLPHPLEVSVLFIMNGECAALLLSNCVGLLWMAHSGSLQPTQALTFYCVLRSLSSPALPAHYRRHLN